MKFTYTDEILTLTADETDRESLRELAAICAENGDHFGTDQQEVEFLEPLIANSELDWTNAAQTGDLTDAPMLCVWGDENTPVAKRWGYEPYQVRSFLTDLMESGQAVFRSSW